MTCRRAFDLDLAAYLVDPRATEWAEFRDHWPACADCAAEVAAWTALQARLGSSHPDAEVLLRWVDGGDALPAAERLAVARHVEACPSCTDELRALARFDVAPHVTAAPAAPARRPWTIRRVLWNPALAYALLLLALLPTLRQRHEVVQMRAGIPPETTAPAPAKAREQAPALADREAPAGDGAGFAGSSRSTDAPAEGRARGLGGAAPAPPPPPSPALERKAAEPPMAERDTRLPEPAPSPQPAARAKTAVPKTAVPKAAPTESRRAPDAMPSAPSDAEAPAFLIIPLPDAARTAGVVEVRIHDADGDRELRERFPVHSDLTVLSFELPPSWRDHSTYEVELRVPGTDVVEHRAITVP
ncbi:MAG TPA: hypothetical protein VGR62_20190 [Candidatus Binatia bacterium]|jgi:hypothetical protein|nr:hypothetical protein [Candidatus Binatia bacterium]